MARFVGGIPSNRGGSNTIADQLAAWAATSEKPKSPGPKKAKTLHGTSDAQMLKHLDEVTEMLRTKKWNLAGPQHFVALYADLHFRVYGVQDLALDSKNRAYAKSAARRMLAEDFGSDPGAMAAFVAWTWTREREKEAWRREKGIDRGRMQWRFQFGKALLVDYRLAVERKKSRSS